MIVAKFGGAVLNSAQGIATACQQMRALPRPLLVVVSAVAQATNRLENLAETAVGDPSSAAAVLQQVVAYHAGIAKELLSAGAYQEWLRAAEPQIMRLQEVVEGITIVRELSARTLDLVVHFGERLSSSLVLSALFESGEDSVTGVSALDTIITDAAHRHAHPDIELTRLNVARHLMPLLQQGGLVVTEGYIARSASGQVTTMGRESSDYTATLLGQLLQATEVRIYTGVQGVQTADPQLVPGARTIERLPYHTARTMAALGAKVLHPRTVGPVEQGSIPLVITAPGGAGTTISSEPSSGQAQPALPSVVLLPEATLLTASSESHEAVDRFVQELRASVPVVWHYQFGREQQVLAAAPYNPATTGGAGSDRPGLNVRRQEACVVSVVFQQPAAAVQSAQFFSALKSLPVMATHLSPDGCAISAAVPADHALQAVQRLHRQFVENEK